MLVHLAFDHDCRSPSIESAIRRWAARLDDAQPIASIAAATV